MTPDQILAEMEALRRERSRIERRMLALSAIAVASSAIALLIWMALK